MISNNMMTKGVSKVGLVISKDSIKVLINANSTDIKEADFWEQLEYLYNNDSKFKNAVLKYHKDAVDFVLVDEDYGTLFTPGSPQICELMWEAKVYKHRNVSAMMLKMAS